MASPYAGTSVAQWAEVILAVRVVSLVSDVISLIVYKSHAMETAEKLVFTWLMSRVLINM
jgi:hypothetical protein